MAQLAQERRHAIAETVGRGSGVVISDLARRFRVSEMTIRRDLKQLEAQGLLTRVHGGAVASVGARFGQRLARQRPGKNRAAEKLCRFLPRQGSI